MTGEQVLRVIVVKQLGGFSYDELEFHLNPRLHRPAVISTNGVRHVAVRSTSVGILQLVRSRQR